MDEYRNDFTRFLDEYRSDNILIGLEPFWQKVMSTYLCYNDIEDDIRSYDLQPERHIAFRVPGATRGHVEVDENFVIKKIVFYPDTCFNSNHNGIECYKKEVVEASNKFIGTVLDIHNGILGDDYLNDEA